MDGNHPSYEAEQTVFAKVREIEAEVAGLEQQIGAVSPEYFALTHPQPLPIADAQALLAPDEAALIGSLFLAPAWIFKGHDSILAIDIGGTNIRAGVVLPNVAKAADLTKASVWKSEKWRHADEKEKLTREQAVDELIGMLKDLSKRAKKEGYDLAPFIGIGCPGKLDEDGSIEKGAQNLPGNWESSRFNLPARLAEAIPQIDGHDTVILMHNDAVVQGLSEAPFMKDVERWGVLTIGTGLGNARFTNRKDE